MQLVKAVLLAGIVLFFFPFKTVLAENRQYAAEELTSEKIFTSQDGLFSLTVPAGQFSQLDIDLYSALAAGLPQTLEPLSLVYYFHLSSPEIKPSDEFLVSLAVTGQNASSAPESAIGQEVYYWQKQPPFWLKAPVVKRTSQAITVKLRGQTNKVVMVKTPVSETAGLSAVAGDNLLKVTLPSFLKTAELVIKITPLSGAWANQFSAIYQVAVKSSASQPLTDLLKSPPIQTCPTYFKQVLVRSQPNQAKEVKKLQQFLKLEPEFSHVQVNGNYDKITAKAVKEFQEKYAAEILRPLALVEGTGQVYQGTLKKLNQLYCQKLSQNDSLIRFSLPYDQLQEKAKTFYFWDTAKQLWQPLASFDDFKSQTVTAFTNLSDLTLAVFEEPRAWVGEASWYAWKNGFFAASRDFAKGSKIKVTNQSLGFNRGQSVVVTINDYGPEEWTGRIIDLDKVAYEQIGNLSGGIMPVRVELLEH